MASRRDPLWTARHHHTHAQDWRVATDTRAEAHTRKRFYNAYFDVVVRGQNRKMRPVAEVQWQESRLAMEAVDRGFAETSWRMSQKADDLVEQGAGWHEAEGLQTGERKSAGRLVQDIQHHLRAHVAEVKHEGQAKGVRVRLRPGRASALGSGLLRAMAQHVI